jgi:hypothetical protein
LRSEDVGHPTVAVKQADAVDSPLSSVGGGFVGIQRHVGAVKAADADVKDARPERSTVVAWDRHAERFDGAQLRRGERDRRRDGYAPPLTA